MELNPIGVIAILGGIVMLYAAVKNRYPQDVVREALGKPALRGPIVTDSGTISGQARTLPTTTPNTGTVIATV